MRRVASILFIVLFTALVLRADYSVAEQPSGARIDSPAPADHPAFITKLSTKTIGEPMNPDMDRG